MITQGRPYIPWSRLQQLVEDGLIVARLSVSNWLRNHGYTGTHYLEVLREGQAEFFKRLTLNDGREADVYFIEHDGEQWYVKVALCESGAEVEVEVDVMSCKWS